MLQKSPWAIGAITSFKDKDRNVRYTKSYEGYKFELINTFDSVWIMFHPTKTVLIGFRLVYAAGGSLEINSLTEHANEIICSARCATGVFSSRVKWSRSAEGEPLLRYTTTLKPAEDVSIPFWPRDVYIAGTGKLNEVNGKVHVSQEGTRSGQLYFRMTKPNAGSILYLQNLTALNDYCEQTKTSCANVVGGNWPELGLSLPPTTEHPILAGKEITISDAIVVFSKDASQEESAMSRQFLNMLADAYLSLPLPATKYHDWPKILSLGLRDLIDSHACWSYVNGHAYFNAYTCDFVTPPEIMVQLAIILPLVDYEEWNNSKIETVDEITETLPAFYDKDLKTIMRWLPAAEDKLDGKEEQLQPKVMDSWYLHHPLLNLSRLALKGVAVAKRLFLDSLPYAIKVAHHFKYEWPVFYQMETLDVIKEETEPGKGGEKDVAGIYAHVMLQAFELTGSRKYLAEAEKAAQTLKGKGFSLLYQANNTAFSAGALVRLYKLTGKKVYLDLCYLCLANIFKNVRLWNCSYGYGRHYPSFFALFPLSNAPYTAVYEEQEVFCAFHDFLNETNGMNILPSATLLITEYIRFLVYRAAYYYPPMLPKDMLAEKPKTGEIDPKLWIALEDMHDGWEKCGSVGQEVYGAGNAFGILPRHYVKVPDEQFMIYADYPVLDIKKSRNKISFTVIGDKKMQCNLAIVSAGTKPPPVKVTAQNTALKNGRRKGGSQFYTINGMSQIVVSWKSSVRKKAK
ncbi:hypothetical protein QTN47_18705 [Danxiaibacter flavus]|uniref:Alpha-L-rhamnosidase six-hairpin glycosidase domain-containing protein n=1 Tax=Danxiaibacter flavus TaxID=3049108 RepID=A0ABV3ZI26_9BACT|nr:hypothetical protein QNM32_18715 [Chitinophagaceae bacterium DXS]